MPVAPILFVAVTAGVAAGVWFPLSIIYVPWLVAGAGLVALVARAGPLAAAGRAAGGVAVVGGACLLGAGASERALHPPLRQLLEERLGGFAIEGTEAGRIETPVVVEGRLVSDAAPTETGAVFRLQVQRVWLGAAAEPAPGGVSLTVSGTLAAGQMGEWRAGRVVRAPALLRRPARYLNAGVADQERAMARRGIALVGTVKSGALVEVVARGSWVDEWAAAVRAWVRASLARHVGSRDPQSGAIATAILIGDRGALDPEVERRLQEAGTYHVIAISGGNIAILAGLVLGALWWVGAGARWSAGAAIATLALFAFVAGGGASVVRATLMACVYLSLRLIDQRTSPVHALALTGVALLVVSPLAIADVGFWLTFGATAAIVAGAARLRLPSIAPARAAAAVVLASASAEAMLMPVGALMFQRVTVAGLVLNLVAVPCMAVVQLAAMATAAADAAGLGLVASGAGWVAHQAAYGLVWSATLVDLAPWITWRVPSPNLWVVAAYYLALVTWVLTPVNHEVHEGHEVNHWVFRKITSWSSWSSWLLFGWIALAPPTLARVHGDGRLHLTAIDVGQGDAFLLTLPNGRTAMVDTGGVTVRGAFDIGDRVIGPALRARGIGRLDYLVVTHGDPDHIGGAWSLARDLSPAEVWVGVPVANHEPTARLRDVAGRRRAAWRTLQRGDRIDIGGVELRVLHPPPPDWERQRVRNNDSVVLALGFGRVSLLLTGDIERDVEAELAPALDLREVVVLKAAHHGSGTSSGEAFLAAAHPALVVISAGRGNPYGHPLPYVLDRYKAVGAEVFRTDQDGQIDVITDGHTVTAESFTGRRWGYPR